MVRLKRIYGPPCAADGRRILVERLWPRGLRKQDAKLDLWLKEIAPSPELRRWFGHDPARWTDFCERYRAELDQRSEALDQLEALSRDGPVTLLFAARDEARNSAVVLKAVLEEQSAGRPPGSALSPGDRE